MFKFLKNLFTPQPKKEKAVRMGALPISVNAPLNARLPRMVARLHRLMQMTQTDEVYADIKRYQEDINSLGYIAPTNPRESADLLKQLGVK
jgi:hypothetical protein